jgi:S1-C subfamily serine protease
MKRSAIYSGARESAAGARPDSWRGNAQSAKQKESAPSFSPPSPQTRFPHAAPRRPPLFADSSALGRLALVLLLAALASALSYIGLTRRPAPLSQKDLDSAVRYSLEHSPAPPSTASAAYAAVEHAVVRVRQLRGEGDKAKEVGVGTGVVITQEGLVLTNLHVIAGAVGAKDLRLVLAFADGSVSDTDIVSADPDRDLALLQAKQPPEELEPATLRSVSGLKTGDEVFAVGFPFGIGPSLSAGVVSGLNRSYASPMDGKIQTGLIQFDAAANPGNSGGPAVDQQGHVIGVLVSGILGSGLSFAVPIALVCERLRSC